MPTSSRLRYVAALDGWRGVAVLAVLLFHAEVSWMPGGFLGVSAFFTLSGFLITSLLLREHDDTGRVDLGAFWARRARRLLPASFLALGLVIVYGAVAAEPAQVRALGGDVLSAMFNVSNWRFIVDDRSYEQLFTAPSPVQHFWSLSIEEQCYIALPLLAFVALGTRRPRRTLFVTLGALCVASIATSVMLADPNNTARAYYGTDTRIAELLIGALAAVVVTSAHGARVLATTFARRALDLGGIVAVVPILWWWTTVDQTDGWLPRGGLALHAVLVTVVVVAATRQTPIARALATRPLVALGRISYGVYVFHWPIYLWLDAERTGLDDGALFALRALVTLAVAIPSFLLIERPIRHGTVITPARARIAIPAALLVVAGGVLAVTADAPEPEFVLEAVSATGPPVSVERSRPARVMVVGDSVALTLGRGLERWGAATGDAVVWNTARKWCAIGRGLERPAVAGAHQGPGCDDWATRWREQIAGFDPDTVVVLSTIWELIDRRSDDWGGWRSPGERAYDDWQLREYTAAVDTLSARGARVVWLTMPCVREPVDPDTPARIERYNDVQLGRRLADARPETVDVVDLHGKVCPDGTFASTIGAVTDARPDGNHFSDPGADAVAAWLMPKLVR
ncbi:MAG TPA: acyltransferase family protein [Acidimicrobiia bacterium]|nr:acyltransferase family protein [Acidimicrobiia bacterium]